RLRSRPVLLRMAKSSTSPTARSARSVQRISTRQEMSRPSSAKTCLNSATAMARVQPCDCSIHLESCTTTDGYTSQTPTTTRSSASHLRKKRRRQSPEPEKATCETESVQPSTNQRESVSRWASYTLRTLTITLFEQSI